MARRSPRRRAEWAPSSAYEEDWRLQARSDGRFVHLVGTGDGPKSNLLIAGDHAIFARDRAGAELPERPLVELAGERRDDRDALIALVDCEFSYATRVDDVFEVRLSTLPFRQGAELPLGWLDAAGRQSDQDRLDTAAVQGWRIESWFEGRRQ